MHSIGIVILHWHNTAEVTKLLQDLESWNNPAFHFIIVDNSREFEHSSLNETTKIIAPESNLGFSGGCNRGIEEAINLQCQFVLLLNADVVIQESDILKLLVAMISNDKLAAVSPLLLEQKNGKAIHHYGGANPLNSSNTRIVDRNSSARLTYLPGTALLIRMTTLKDIGFLDENYFFSGEVADWFMRLNETHWKFALCEQVVVVHLNSGNENYRNKHYIYYSLRNRYLLIRKFGGESRKSLEKNWTKQLRRQMIGALTRLNIGKFLVVFRAIKDGVSGRFGPSKYFMD